MSKSASSDPPADKSASGSLSDADQTADASVIEQTSDKASEKASEKADQSQEPPVRYTISGGFIRFLHAHDISVAATSYQSGRLYLLGRNPKGGLMVNEQAFHKAMGLYMAGKTLLMATLAHIYRMENILKPNQVMDETFTECYVPRTGHFTGVLDAHDIGITADDEIIFVNTRYNCLATTSKQHSFKPIWKPNFISRIIAEDRCHLNGLAMHEGKPAYVTAICRSDTIDGWRDRRADGGIVMDVEKNEIICDGLSMPHSPRMHDGKLWLLNSGTGDLGYVEGEKKGAKGTFKPVVFCPGFVRGLAFHKHYAFVGLSKPRYERFEGLELDQRLKDKDSEPWCGIQVIDLNTGQCVHWFRIDGQIGELYDVAIVPNAFCPKSIGFTTNEAFGIITIEDADDPVLNAR